MRLEPPSPIVYRPLVDAALREDLGDAGDITSEAVVPAATQATAAIVARRAGTLAGIEPALWAFRLTGPDADDRREGPRRRTLRGRHDARDDSGLRAGHPRRRADRAQPVGRLTGIATTTAAFVAAVEPYRAAISCTRKTTPGLRAWKKYAVRAGGGVDHRFGLYDAVLIKDNHIAVAGGVTAAVRAARAGTGHLVKVEIEVDTPAQLREALDAGADVILLDNMSLDQMREAVAVTDGRALLEASGSVRLDTVNAIAATGVDVISVGSLTHSAPALDIGLDIAP